MCFSWCVTPLRTTNKTECSKCKLRKSLVLPVVIFHFQFFFRLSTLVYPLPTNASLLSQAHYHSADHFHSSLLNHTFSLTQSHFLQSVRWPLLFHAASLKYTLLLIIHSFLLLLSLLLFLLGLQRQGPRSLRHLGHANTVLLPIAALQLAGAALPLLTAIVGAKFRLGSQSLEGLTWLGLDLLVAGEDDFDLAVEDGAAALDAGGVGGLREEEGGGGED